MWGGDGTDSLLLEQCVLRDRDFIQLFTRRRRSSSCWGDKGVGLRGEPGSAW